MKCMDGGMAFSEIKLNGVYEASYFAVKAEPHFSR
jgi:hypothetical protein